MKIALITAPPDEAEPLARRLVESSLAACVNILPAVTSVYRWKGGICSDKEFLLIAKVSEENADELVRSVSEWHSYECPECILVDVAGGNPDYLRWVRDPAADA